MIPTLMEAVVEGDAVRIKELRKGITRAEHEADIVKNELRANLPRTLFMPVSRADVLQLLHDQDDIADGAEDAAILADLKILNVPVELRRQVIDYAEICVQAARLAEKVVGKLGELLETGFTGPESGEVMKLIDAVGEQEWEADKAAFKLLKALFNSPESIHQPDLCVWMKLSEALGDIADAAEQVANRLRLMLAR
jgi:predicted phosphate transport protein (TIGR00153 family)